MAPPLVVLSALLSGGSFATTMRPMPPAEPDPRLAAAVASLTAGLPDGAPPVHPMRALSAAGFGVGGHLFAFVAGEGRLIAKVPSAVVDGYEQTGTGTRMAMRGRPMREWVEVPPEAGDAAWAEVVAAAYAFVSGG